MRIRAVFFDLDDTLFAHRRSVDLGVVAQVRADGHELGPEQKAALVARWQELEERHYRRYLAREIGYLDQRQERATALLADYGLTPSPDEALAWFDAYLVHYRAAWALHDDVPAVLDEFGRQGLALGVITNGDPVFQRGKLEGLGVAERLPILVASGELGIAKPDPRIFGVAAARAGVGPAEVLYVGDRLRTDAIGAAEAGLTGVWIDRPGAATGDELADARAAGAHVIRSLAELPALVSRSSSAD